MKNIVVHVDRLVLRGVARADAAAFAAGLQTELQTLLGAAGAIDALAVHAGREAAVRSHARVPAGIDAMGIGRAVGGCIAKPASITAKETSR